MSLVLSRLYGIGYWVMHSDVPSLKKIVFFHGGSDCLGATIGYSPNPDASNPDAGVTRSA